MAHIKDKKQTLKVRRKVVMFLLMDGRLSEDTCCNVLGKAKQNMSYEKFMKVIVVVM